MYYGTKGEVTTKFDSSTEAFHVAGRGEIEVRGRLAITNMSGSVIIGQSDLNVTSKVVIAGNGEMYYKAVDSSFKVYPPARIEAKDYGVFQIATANGTWSQNGGTMDFSGHSKLKADIWGVPLGQGQTVFRDDAMLAAGTSSRLCFPSVAGEPTEVWFKDRATFQSGTGAHLELFPEKGGRVKVHFDSTATHSAGYLKMGRTQRNGFIDLYLSDGVLKADSSCGFNQGGGSTYYNANSFTTGHVYQTGGAFIVNGESGGYYDNLQYGFILGDVNNDS